MPDISAVAESTVLTGTVKINSVVFDLSSSEISDQVFAGTTVFVTDFPEQVNSISYLYLS